jgi:hypothetical protein
MHPRLNPCPRGSDAVDFFFARRNSQLERLHLAHPDGSAEIEGISPLQGNVDVENCVRRHALEDAGVTIAPGTDAGNIGTIHGPALFREFQLMKEAGPKIGAIAPGNFADLVILKANPIDDIAHASDIESVMKNGVLFPADAFAR